jgi:hypothetical protein
MNSGVLSEIELMAVGLPVGSSQRYVCPFCEDSERSFRVTRRDSGVGYDCYRASCEAGGFIPSAGYGSDDYTKPAVPAKPAHEPYRGQVLKLDARDQRYFFDRFGLLPEVTLDWVKYNEHNEYVLPVYEKEGRRVGFNVRTVPWSGRPSAPRQPEQRTVYRGKPAKVKLMMDKPDGIALSWYAHDRWSGTFVIVEDQISAMKVAQAGLTGIALLGVGLDLNKLREIQIMKPQEVVFALDADASKTAFKLGREYGMAFKRTRVVLLERDLKDIPSEDILSTLLIEE